MTGIKYLNYKLLIVAIILYINHSHSQTSPVDSVNYLREVTVESCRQIDFAIGNRFENIDTGISKFYFSNSLANLLSDQSSIFIKSNGVSGLSTCSFRGAGAGHTEILWNGFSLSSPMNGQVDLSLIPSGIANNILLQSGGSGALFGNGAIGGVIHLDNDIQVFENKLSLGISSAVASYHNYFQNLDIRLSNQEYITLINIFNHTGENDFPFRNIAEPDAPVQILKNSNVTQYGLIDENYFKLNNSQNLNFRFWYQNNYSCLPPTMLQDNSSSNQKDESLRFSSEWQLKKDFYNCLVRAAALFETTEYKDVLSGIDESSRAQTYISDIENKFTLNDHNLINIDLTNSFGLGKSPDYLNTEKLNQFSPVISYKFLSKNGVMKTSVNLRWLIAGNKSTPIIPSIGTELKLNNSLVLKGNVSGTYSTPTLNDLYWVPGGNPVLKPEHGWSEEIGLTSEVKHFYFNLTCFNSNVNDWIIWIPEGDIWSPENIALVWSRGLESNFRLHYSFGKLKFIFSFSGTYTLSTNEKNKMLNDNSYGKQLIYVPVTDGQGRCILEYCSYSLIYSQTYTGKCWTTEDNSEFLNPYSIGNLIISKQLSINYFRFEISFRINNIWNTEYQVTSWVPMPPRSYQVALKINFTK